MVSQVKDMYVAYKGPSQLCSETNSELQHASPNLI